MKKVFVVGIAIIFSLVIYSIVTGQITNVRIKKEVKKWQQILDSEIPSGMTKEKIEEWRQKRPESEYWTFNSPKNLFYGNVAQVKDAGIGFPCSEWNIIIQIHIDENDTSSKKDVHTVGTCI